MLSPGEWKPEHRAGLVVASAAGAAIGLAIGLSRRPNRFFDWVSEYPGDAFFWAAAGALVVGAAVYCYRVFSV